VIRDLTKIKVPISSRLVSPTDPKVAKVYVKSMVLNEVHRRTMKNTVKSKMKRAQIGYQILSPTCLGATAKNQRINLRAKLSKKVIIVGAYSRQSPLSLIV
jgi:hypothetical protein